MYAVTLEVDIVSNVSGQLRLDLPDLAADPLVFLEWSKAEPKDFYRVADGLSFEREYVINHRFPAKLRRGESLTGMLVGTCHVHWPVGLKWIPGSLDFRDQFANTYSTDLPLYRIGCDRAKKTERKHRPLFGGPLQTEVTEDCRVPDSSPSKMPSLLERRRSFEPLELGADTERGPENG